MSTKMKYLTTFIVILVLAIAGYFYWQSEKKKSPEYSLTLLQTAGTTHDWDNFQKHIDLNTFYAKAFDDVIAPTLRQSDNKAINEFLAGILGTIKTTFVTSMIDHTKSFVTTGTINEKIDLPEQIFTKRFVNMLNFKYLVFKSVQSTKITGNIALVAINVTDKKLKKDFIMELKMSRLADETWKVESINNIADLLVAINNAQTEKLQELNKPITDKIAKEISIKSNTFDIKTRTTPWVSTAFVYKPTIFFSSKEQITGFIGQVQVLNKNKDVIYTQKYIVPGPFSIGTSKEYNFSWTLNPFVAGDKALINANPKDLTLRETILRVRFENGEEMQLLEVIPEENDSSTKNAA